jgi:hypothetical protein
MSILPAMRNRSLVSPDSVRTGMKPTIVTVVAVVYEHHHGVRWGNPRLFLFFVPGKLMAALAYRDDKKLGTKPAFAPILLFDPGGAILPPRPQFDCAIVSSGSQGWPRFSRPPEGLVLDGREHDGTLAVSERKTTMRGGGAGLVTTTIVAVPVPVPAVSTEVRELQSGSPSIISI